MKSLFPAYGIPENKGAPSAENKNSGDDKLGWLQNISYTSHNAEDLASIARVTSELSKEKSHEEVPEKGDLGVGTAQPDIYEFSDLCVKQTKCKHKNKKRKSESHSRSSSVESWTQQNLKLIEGSSKKIFIEDVGLHPEHAFRVDRKSDRNNLAFTSLSHHQIPKYVRSLPRISNSGTSKLNYWLPNVESLKKDKSRSNPKYERYYNHLKHLYDETNIVDLSSGGINLRGEFKNTLQRAYLPFEVPVSEPDTVTITKARIENISSNPLGIYDPNTTLYFEGKGIPQENSSNMESEPMPKQETYKETRDEYIQRLTIEYNKYVRENPHDVKKWIEFVKFQNDAVESSQFVDSLKTTKHRKMTETALLEKKIAILDRAIENNPKSVELIVFKYDLCKDVWDTDKLSSEWKKIMFLHPNNTWLWQQYMQFFQTRFSAFTVTKFSKLYTKCFDMLKKIHGGHFQSHKPLPHMEENMLEIFSKFCHVLYQCGYREKAIANFQALIEFNFFPPKHLSHSAPLDNWIAFFEPFWDSGIPRFGEKSAPGWCNAMKHKDLHLTPRLNPDDENEDNIVKPGSVRWENWLNLEKFRERHNWLPWRPSELEDECEDPDRMVLFDDISPSIFRIQNDYSKFILLVRFLELLGVRFSPHYQVMCKLLSCHDPYRVTESSEILDGHRQFVWRFYSSNRSSSMLSLDALACRTSVFQDFVDNVFQQSCSVLRGSFKSCVILLWVNSHFEKLRSLRGDVKTFKNQLKETKKFVKTFLKMDENRNNLALWCKYAKLEWWGKSFDDARKIFDLTLVNHAQTHGQWNKMENTQKSSLCMVCRTYIMLELGCDEEFVPFEVEFKNGSTRALAILLSLGTDAKFAPSNTKIQISPALLLKSKHHYKAVFEELIKDYFDSNTVDNFELGICHLQRHLLIDWTVCYAVFEYLTDSFAAASVVFKTIIQRLTSVFSASIAHDRDATATDLRNWSNCEFLYMQYIHLNVLHSNVCPSAPLTLLRNGLHEALELFPENEQFNNLLLDIEAKSHIAGRLRVHYDAQLKENSLPGFTSAIFAIVAELERQKNLRDSAALASTVEIYGTSSVLVVETGITHRLRALFEKIVRNVQLRHCILVWRLYIKFEVMQANQKHAKDIFYNALQECPWAKVLYLDAIEHFPEDIQELNDLMTEKEIRIQAPLEEVDLLMKSIQVSGDTENISYNLEDICLPPSPACNSTST